MLVKIKDRWINPEAITHLVGFDSTRVHLLSGTYTDVQGVTPDEVVQAIDEAQTIKLNIPESLADHGADGWWGDRADLWGDRT